MPSSPHSARRFCIILLFFLGALFCIERATPLLFPQTLFYRPYEYMMGFLRYNYTRKGQTLSREAYGDLANMLHIRSFQQHRSTTFTVDKNGFRNAPETQYDNPKIMVAGDSFMAGVSNADSDTFASVLQKNFTESVSAYAPSDISKIIKKIRNTEQKPSVILWGRVERNLQAYDAEMRKLFSDTSCFQEESWKERVIEPLKTLVKDQVKDVVEYARLSIVRRVLQFGYHEIRYRLFGTHNSNVIIGNDKETLFFAKGVRMLSSDAQKRGMEKVVKAITHARDCLETQNITLVVLPIPNKAHVHRNLLPMEEIALEQEFDKDPLHVLYEELQKENIYVVDLWSVFMKTDQLLYRADDTHWNPAGIRLAVETALPVLQEAFSARTRKL